MKKRLFAILLALVMALGLTVTAGAEEATDLNERLGTASTTAENVVFAYDALNKPMTVTVTGYVLNNGNYKLTGDLTIAAPLVIQDTVTLDLNGHVLTYENSEKKNSVIVVDDGEGVSFTLKDSGSGGKITGGTGTDTGYYDEYTNTSICHYQGGGVFVGSKATFNMSGGSIENCSATGGADDKGGGVYLASGHNENQGNITYTTFNMTGGSIENCSSGQGGGVGTGSYANITIEKSKIIGCVATGSGGGVGANGAGNILSMTNSTISNCTATIYGGGVSAGSSSGDGTFTMENSSITNCTAQVGGGVYNDCGYFTMKDGSTISGCKAIFDPATIGVRWHGGGGVYIREEVFTMEAGSVISGCTSSDGKSDSLNLGNENHCYMRTYGGSVYGSVYNRNCNIENTATDGSTIFYNGITNGDAGRIVGKRVRFMKDGSLYAETVANENENGKISQPDAPTAPEGKAFAGWSYTKSDGSTGMWDFGSTFAMNAPECSQEKYISKPSITWDVATLTAVWVESTPPTNPSDTTTRPTPKPTTETVTSPNTADAGVLLTATLSVASLLGMGYVSKKR